MTYTYEAEEAKAVADYEKEISEVIALGAGTRKRALLWMLDSEEGVPKTEFEIENWMWNRGLLSDEKIKKELIRTVKPIWKATNWINA